MKKVLMLCLGLVLSSSIYSKISYNKSGGFFNRYKFVTQTNFNNGNIFMECHDPGWTRCRAQTLFIRFDGVDTPVTAEEFDVIDATVTKSAAGGNDSGKFIFNEKFFISFTYNAETDNLSTSIYTIAEAHSLNLL